MAIGKLKVGAAKLSITPTADMFPLGAMVGAYEGVREGEEINVRAIIIDNGERVFLLEGFELGGVPCPDVLRPALEEKYGIKQENMLLTGTHNHSAPHVAGRARPGDVSEPRPVEDNVRAYTNLVLKNSVDVVGLAMQNMKPAKYGYGEGKSYINVNRDQPFDDGYWMQGMNWEGCSDKTLGVIKFVDEEDNLIAAVLNYAMHSTTSFCTLDVDGKVKVTCDAPGIACNLVEAYYGNDAVVLWQSGAAGNQNPYYVGIMQVFDKDGVMRERRRLPGAAYEQGVVFGQQHGMDAIRALKAIDAKKDKMKITTVDSTLYFPTQRFPHDKFDWAYHRLVVDNLLEWSGHVTAEEPMPEKKLADMIPCEEKAPMKTQLVLLGDIAIYGVACELYNDIGVQCKEASPFKHTMIATHIGDPAVGYILDDGSVGHKVFQSFGLVGAGGNDEIVVNGMLEMFDEAL